MQGDTAIATYVKQYAAVRANPNQVDRQDLTDVLSQELWYVEAENIKIKPASENGDLISDPVGKGLELSEVCADVQSP